MHIERDNAYIVVILKISEEDDQQLKERPSKFLILKILLGFLFFQLAGPSKLAVRMYLHRLIIAY